MRKKPRGGGYNETGITSSSPRERRPDHEMITASARFAQPAGWKRQWREAITDPLELLSALDLTALAERIAVPGADEFPLRVPRDYVRRMRRGDSADPLLRQVLPLSEERLIVPGFGIDAVGDGAARAGTGVIHKYDGRALLIATGSCAVHCRYCFRRHFPYAEETAAAGAWRGAIAFARAHPAVSELILSGGDPWSLSTAKLAELTDALRDVPTIRRLRVHTRLPVVLPARVDAELVAWIAALPVPLVVVIHANHAQEFDAGVDAAIAALRDAGATVLNQSVLLRGVNDDADTLTALSERLFAAGVLPYYLHVLDRVAGTAHFDVPDAEARALHRRLRARLPGYLVPRLVREIAGQEAKTPL
jgi:L-lysine 2,3-aminomutase